MKRKAIFFDRDGVLINDVHLLTEVTQVAFPDLLWFALTQLVELDFAAFVVTNQTVVARGLASEEQVELVNNYITNKIHRKTGLQFTKVYYCPHHPQATLKKYQQNCECRKPKPGLLLQAASEFDINLAASWMIGDRISDIIAGAKAGCRTIHLQSGSHLEKPIISDSIDLSVRTDHTCSNILEAINIITNN